MTDKSIEDRLRSEGPERRAPAGLTERVMSRIPPQEAKADYVKPSSFFWPRFAISFAAIAIALVVASEFWNRPQTPATANNDSKPSQVIEVASIEPIEIPIPTITAEQVQALTEKIDQPLEKELKNVISDTRLAIQFVASNFLPEQ
jgi:hypothetical protein